MGQEVTDRPFTATDRRRYRAKIHQCLEALRRMLRDDRFAADAPRTGVEIELALVDDRMSPAMVNDRVLGHPRLERSAAEVLTSELGRWNLEINLPPRMLPGGSAAALERDMVDAVATARACAAGAGATPVTIGILPTLTAEHLGSEHLTEDPRYALLNRQMVRARGESFRLDIDEPERADGAAAEHLLLDVESIAPEAACTSLQLHLQLTPEAFPVYWNAAQAVAGVQVALGANSPFLLGHRLWAETRVPLFTQAVDTRSEELRVQGVRPRVWFGDRWATAAYDLFEENVRYFPALLPVSEDEDPLAVLDADGAPELAELRMHNGTVWRWNRPVYDVAGGVPHLRLENRVLPAGPTEVDAVANAMFFYGVVRGLAAAEHPPWERMSFAAAEENFEAAARHGMRARQFWPGLGHVRVGELVDTVLLPLARQGLDAWGVDPADAERYLSIVVDRCRTGRTGAVWQTDVVDRLERDGATRAEALREMLARYVARSTANEPVHTWAP